MKENSLKDTSVMNLLGVFKNLNPKDERNNLLLGEVVAINPLAIKLCDTEVVLPEACLYVGQWCRPVNVTIPHNHLINALESNSSKAIKTTKISDGTPTEGTNTGSYDIKTQTITRNDDNGVDDKKLETDDKSKLNIDLGGANLGMKVSATSTTTATIGTGGVGVVTTTVTSSFDVEDNGHKHIVPEHETQDVHFPETKFEKFVTFEIYPRLKVKDIVLLFAFNNFQKYYVAERITNGS